MARRRTKLRIRQQCDMVIGEENLLMKMMEKMRMEREGRKEKSDPKNGGLLSSYLLAHREVNLFLEEKK